MQGYQVEILDVPAVRRPSRDGEPGRRGARALLELNDHGDLVIRRVSWLRNGRLIVPQQSNHDLFALLELRPLDLLTLRPFRVAPHDRDRLHVLRASRREKSLHGRPWVFGAGERPTARRAGTRGEKQHESDGVFQRWAPFV